MWNYKKKTSKEGNPMTKSQRQAWIENWTIWALKGMIGALNNILQQARSNQLKSHKHLQLLIWDMIDTIEQIKETQRARKAKRKL